MAGHARLGKVRARQREPGTGVVVDRIERRQESVDGVAALAGAAVGPGSELPLMPVGVAIDAALVG